MCPRVDELMTHPATLNVMTRFAAIETSEGMRHGGLPNAGGSAGSTDRRHRTGRGSPGEGHRERVTGRGSLSIPSRTARNSAARPVQIGRHRAGGDRDARTRRSSCWIFPIRSSQSTVCAWSQQTAAGLCVDRLKANSTGRRTQPGQGMERERLWRPERQGSLSGVRSTLHAQDGIGRSQDLCAIRHARMPTRPQSITRCRSHPRPGTCVRLSSETA